MSNIIEVTPERLHNDAALLRQKANKIQAELDNVEQQIRSLSAADFEGLAASDFLAEYHRLRNMLQMLPKMLAMFSQQLDQAGNEFAQVDHHMGGQSHQRGHDRHHDSRPNPPVPPPQSQLPVELPMDRRLAAESYARQIDEFNVEKNPAYLPRDGKTYCNIFASDVAKSFNAPLPQWIDYNTDGNPDDYLDANEMVQWLNGSYNKFGSLTGPQLGWKSVDAATAGQMANQGHVVIAGWYNPGDTGHMAVVRPGSDESGNLAGIRIAQAGSSNVNNASLMDHFYPNTKIEFFVYERP